MAIKKAYKLLYNSGMNFTQAIEKIDQEEPAPEVREIIDFFRSSKRGVIGSYQEEETSSEEKPESAAMPHRNIVEINV